MFISPGLHAVLLIIRTVSLHDSVARLAFCEHPVWTALNILLGVLLKKNSYISLNQNFNI